jgi:hypothetical protein
MPIDRFGCIRVESDSRNRCPRCHISDGRTYLLTGNAEGTTADRRNRCQRRK